MGYKYKPTRYGLRFSCSPLKYFTFQLQWQIDSHYPMWL